MGKNIQRVRPQGVILGHGLWRHGLSLKALGLLYLLLDLSQLPDWEFSLAGLVALAQRHGLADRRDAIRSALAELEAKAFLQRQRTRSDGGQLAGSQWWISDQPIAAEASAPTSENPTLADRLQEGSSSIEEEKTQRSPSTSPADGGVAEALQQLWNQRAPAHWVRLRELGPKRRRALAGLVREFGSAAKAQAALEASLLQAHRESWCMQASARLSLENWLSNGKVRQYSEKRQQLEQPAAALLSGEQEEIAALAAQHPQLFEGVRLEDGVLRVRYSRQVQQQADYPAQGLVMTVAALRADIALLQQRLGAAVCPL